MDKRLMLLMPIVVLSVASCNTRPNMPSTTTQPTSTSTSTSTSEEPEPEPEPEPLPEGVTSSLLNSESRITAEDNNNHFETTADGYHFAMIGFTDNATAFGKIKKTTFGSGANAVTYPGIVYNRSLISLHSINVKYSGAKLYYIFSEYLMEDMNFNEAKELVSGKLVEATAKAGYFIIYTNSTDGADIESISVNHSDDKTLFNSLAFTDAQDTKYARSAAKNIKRYADYMEFDNNPTNYTNNYSIGKHDGHTYNDSWYRWNGIALYNSPINLGKHFELHTTIIGNISQIIDPTNYFHFAPWPEFSQGGANPQNDGWSYIYIGNDNYEPLGHNDPNRIHKDTYGDYSYAGRFFTKYSWDETAQDWVFYDPDTTTVIGGTKTLREAYETYTLPFWHVKFVIENNSCDVYINGFKIDSFDELFSADDYTGQDLSIYTMAFHAVNYGKAENEAAERYHAVFTYPRFKAL